MGDTISRGAVIKVSTLGSDDSPKEWTWIRRTKKSWQASGCSIHCWSTVSSVIYINQCFDRGSTTPLPVYYITRLNDYVNI
jgi:hypothetical protein